MRGSISSRSIRATVALVTPPVDPNWSCFDPWPVDPPLGPPVRPGARIIRLLERG
jgi:hypothetical protein